MAEEWKPIPDSENQYFVSSFGRFKSLKGGKEHFLKPVFMRESGYYRISISINGKFKSFYAHRLVAEAFIPNPDNKPQVNHINEDKGKNSASNLEWTTPKENSNWGTGIERAAVKKRVPVNSIDKNGIKRLYTSVGEAAKKIGVPIQSVSAVISGKRKTCKGFIFERAIKED